MSLPRRTLIVLALLLTLPFPSCKKMDDDDAENPLPTSEEINIRVDPKLIEFSHVVGQSPCPQLIGRITIRNAGTSPFTTDVRARDPRAPLSFSPDRTVEPGATVTIDVFFNCNSQASFQVTVDTLRENEAQQATGALPPGSLNIAGIITRP